MNDEKVADNVPEIKAHVDRLANVTIEFNAQATCLRAPSPLPNGSGQWIYLPCCTCSRLDVVPMGTISTVCADCAEHRKTCDDLDCTREVCRIGYQP